MRRDIYGMVIALSVVILTVWRAGRDRRFATLIGGLLPLISVGALYLAWFSLTGMPGGKKYAGSFGLVEAWRLFGDWMLTGSALATSDSAFTMGVGGFVVLLLIAGLFRIVKCGRSAMTLVALVSGVPALLAVLNLVGRDRTYLPRSAAFSIPGFMLVLAAGLLSLRSQALRIGAVGAVLILQLAALVGFHQRQPANETGSPHPDWRSIARVLDEEVGGGGGRSPCAAELCRRAACLLLRPHLGGDGHHAGPRRTGCASKEGRGVGDSGIPG